MTARDDELRELAAAWALGSLSPEEAREFEALMARSPELQSEADSYREVAAMLPLGAGVLAPDPGLKARVLARAVLWHAERRVLPNGSRTVVFR